MTLKNKVVMIFLSRYSCTNTYYLPNFKKDAYEDIVNFYEDAPNKHTLI